ncbi:glycosyltransferase family 2 protein [uncultured Ilyobacter sp.]|uniref:glycosyltransferase family 2 protein n=1 Tax=uncultured Ilyobacter sp. TaxID=544433 RepID=UPI0029F4E75E|nr:glycosyltransferase family 2 protein [uncultured Ilyobacter sp.]
MTNLLDYENNFLKIESIESKLIYGDLNFNKNPALTIAIPTYKRPLLLKEALDSALNQIDYIDYEVIVVDNDSDSDTETEKLIKSYNNPKLLYYKNEVNLGLVGNWNRCIELARGKWYSMLHDDDLLAETFLKEAVKVLDKNPNISFLKVNNLILDERDLTKKDRLKLKFIEKIKNLRKKLRRLKEVDYIINNPMNGPVGIIMKKENAMSLGGFSERAYPALDYVFFTRYFLKYDTYFYNKTLCYYRISKNESFKQGVMISCAKINYYVIQELINPHFFKKIIFKKYPLYYVLITAKKVKNYLKLNITEEELSFLKENNHLNFFWFPFYWFIRVVWFFKTCIF